MNGILEQHRTECATILEKLLAAPVHPFDDNLKSRLPVEHGLYVIARKDESGQYEYLHAGRTKTGAMGLRRRIWDDHFWGGGKGAESDFVDKVIKKLYRQLGIPQGSTTNRQYRDSAQKWIRENCFVQWTAEQDSDLRCWAEHYILSILRPIWGR